MNQKGVIALASIIVLFAPVQSFAQGPDEPLSIFEILQQIIDSGNLKVTTHGSPQNFVHATLVLSSSTDLKGPKNPSDFENGTVHFSSSTDIHKVTMCHVSPGNQKHHTISIAGPAVSAHLAHGDHVGECTVSNTDDASGVNANHDAKPFKEKPSHDAKDRKEKPSHDAKEKQSSKGKKQSKF